MAIVGARFEYSERFLMQAVILAGGLGTRLRPLTYTIPKPMLPVANRPALVHTIEALADAGFSEVIITTNYLAETIRATLDTLDLPLPVRCIKEEKPLGTAGCIQNIIDLLDEDFLIIQGDAVADIDYRRLVEFHRTKNADITIAAMLVQDTREFGIVTADEDGRITRFQEKPRPEEAFSHMANTGFYMVKKAVFDDAPPAGEIYDFSLHLFPRLMAAGARFYAWQMGGYWIDIGRVNNYLEGNHHRIKGRAEIASGVHVPESATLVSPFLIGEGTHIGEGCVIGPYTIVAQRCTLGNNSRISGSVLYHDVSIGESARLSDCVVASSTQIGAQSIVEPMAIIGEGCEIAARVQVRAHSKVGPVTPVAPGTVVDGVVSPRLEKLENLQRVLERRPLFKDLSTEQLRICALLAEFGELSARALADAAKIPFSRVHPMLHALEVEHIVLSTLDMPKRYALTHE
jgi:NDP-sugar pyrophosphorylase family protein